MSRSLSPRGKALRESVSISGSDENPSAEWISAVLKAAGASELENKESVQLALAQLFRIVSEHKQFAETFPHLSTIQEERRNLCAAGVNERWGKEENSQAIVKSLVDLYEKYGFPVDAGEQLAALHLATGGGCANINAPIAQALRASELNYLCDNGLIEVEYL